MIPPDLNQRVLYTLIDTSGIAVRCAAAQTIWDKKIKWNNMWTTGFGVLYGEDGKRELFGRM